MATEKLQPTELRTLPGAGLISTEGFCVSSGTYAYGVLNQYEQWAVEKGIGQFQRPFRHILVPGVITDRDRIIVQDLPAFELSFGKLEDYRRRPPMALVQHSLNSLVNFELLMVIGQQLKIENDSLSNPVRLAPPLYDQDSQTLLYPVYVVNPNQRVNPYQKCADFFIPFDLDQPPADQWAVAARAAMVRHWEALVVSKRYKVGDQDRDIGFRLKQGAEVASDWDTHRVAAMALAIEKKLRSYASTDLPSRDYLLDELWKIVSWLPPGNCKDEPEHGLSFDFDSWPADRKTRLFFHTIGLLEPTSWYSVKIPGLPYSRYFIFYPYAGDLPEYIRFKDGVSKLYFGHIYIHEELAQISELVRAIFNAIGPKNYDLLTQGFPREIILEQLIMEEEVIRRMKTGGLILDVGCGSGHLARLMPKLTDKIPGLADKCIYAFDIAEKMLEEAAKQQAVKKTQRGDIQQIVPFADEDKPSVAVVSYLLHYLKDPLSAFRNVFSALDDGGIITIAIRRPEGESWDEEVCGLLRQAGFGPYKARTIMVSVVDQIKGDEIPVGLVYAIKKS